MTQQSKRRGNGGWGTTTKDDDGNKQRGRTRTRTRDNDTGGQRNNNQKEDRMKDNVLPEQGVLVRAPHLSQVTKERARERRRT